MHLLLARLLSAAKGDFPDVDGGVTVLPPLHGGLECSFAFTGHAYVATARAASDVHAAGPDGFGGSMSPDFLRWLAGPGGEIGVLDVTLTAPGRGGGRLAVRDDVDDHHRVRHARKIRRDVRVHGDERGFVTLSAGLAGRRELSIESSPDGFGHGRSLIADALRLVPEGESVFAAVSPGNARSVRAFLAAGFVPVGSEVIIRPQGTV